MDDLVTTFFPAECRCCEGPLLRAGSVPVCEACVDRVRRSELAGCSRCGEGLDLDLQMEDIRFAGMLPEGLLCRECRLAAPEFERAVAYATYDGELRGLIRLLKFARVRGVAKLLGGRMAEAILQLEGAAANELLVIAVPLFKRRERQRGYNQSVLLADEALRRLRALRPGWKLVAAHRAIERRRSTESSFELSRKGRRRNLSGAFRVSGDVRGREVLLIDDILTSGATARECARVLKRAGAAKVWVATLARAQKEFVKRQHDDPRELVAGWDLGQARSTAILASPE
jgi:ComF family protein